MQKLKIKIKNLIDKIWIISEDFNYKIISEVVEKPFSNEKPKFEEEEINNSYEKDNKFWIHSEYIKQLKKRITIEPDYSYCITGFNKIIGANVFYPNIRPSFPRYILNLLKRNTNLSCVIHFDGHAGTNYFHFFSDVINKIWLIERIDNYENIPILIGEKTYKTLYFQYLLNNTKIKNYNWIVQTANEYIRTDEVFFIRPMPYRKEYFEKLKNLIIKEPEKRYKRLFLNRSIETGRYISNFREIQPILEKYSFEIIDTNNLALDKQAYLFNSIDCLVSIHGAGQTNIIFSDKKLKFLEINPINRIACQYYWLSLTLKIKHYDVILGGELSNAKSGFYLDPKKLENAIIKMLNS